MLQWSFQEVRDARSMNACQGKPELVGSSWPRWWSRGVLPARPQECSCSSLWRIASKDHMFQMLGWSYRDGCLPFWVPVLLCLNPSLVSCSSLWLWGVGSLPCWKSVICILIFAGTHSRVFTFSFSGDYELGLWRNAGLTRTLGIPRDKVAAFCTMR